MLENNNIYFHGSTLPPGSDSKELRKPTVDRPFFVGDKIEIAKWYTDQYETFGGVRSTSIFILRTKEDLDDISFFFRRPSHLSKLSGKFPDLVETMKVELPWQLSFFNIVHSLAFVLDGTLFGSGSKFKPVATEYKVREPTIVRRVKTLIQMGFVERDPVTKELFPSEDVAKILKSSLNDEQRYVQLRRLIKAPVFDEIHHLGFSTIKEWDTTPISIGWEYAVLDMDVFEGGWNKSIKVYEASKVLKTMEKENGK